MILDRLASFFRPSHDPDIVRLTKKAEKARSNLLYQLDCETGARDLARAMLEALNDEVD